MSIIRREGEKRGEELLKNIYEEIASFIGSRGQYDDITLVVIERE